MLHRLAQQQSKRGGPSTKMLHQSKTNYSVTIMLPADSHHCATSSRVGRAGWRHSGCIKDKQGQLTHNTKDMSPHRTVNRMWRPSLLKLPPVSNRMKVDTNSAPMVYSSAQCTGGSNRQAVACLSLCACANRCEACRISPTSVPARL